MEETIKTSSMETTKKKDPGQVTQIKLKDLDLKIPPGLQNWTIGNDYRNVPGSKDEKNPQKW